jgi:hypothetical protein
MKVKPEIKTISVDAEPINLKVNKRDFDIEAFEAWMQKTKSVFPLSPSIRLRLTLKHKNNEN